MSRRPGVPFQTLIDYIEAGQPLSEFLEDFPTVSSEQAIAALKEAQKRFSPLRVLLDECVPRRLKRDLPGHDTQTAPEMGWASKRNGDLLLVAEQEFDVFLTVVQKLQLSNTAAQQ